MSLDEKLLLLEERKKEALLGGGPEKIEKQHKLGKLTARERLDILLDKDSFLELHMFAQHHCHDFGMEKYRPYGDGVVTGCGTIDGRKVFVYAQDFTVMGGSVGHTHVDKIVFVMRLARKTKCPFIALVDSVGGRIQEGSGTWAHVFVENVLCSGVIPQISVIMGNCAGGGVYSPALTDFIFMVQGTSQMFITGPAVIKAVTGEDISMQDLGGAKPHSEISGVCDAVFENDEKTLLAVRKLLSYLPQSYLEKPKIVDTGDDPKRIDLSLREVVPENPKRGFDMYRIIRSVVDNGDFFEIKPKFARNIITGFARIGGFPVGICANQPIYLAGSLDCDASDKAARFYRVCDCFNIPIVTFVDVPGYLPGVREEHKGIIRHGAKMLYGYIEATVPKITCIVRKAYGGSYAAMGCREVGADIVVAWPTSEIAIMGAEGAVNVLYRKELQAAKSDEEREKIREEKIREYREKFTTPYYASSKMMTDILIDPAHTRPVIIEALKLLWDKEDKIPERKHGNIPL